MRVNKTTEIVELDSSQQYQNKIIANNSNDGFAKKLSILKKKTKIPKYIEEKSLHLTLHSI